MDLRTTADGLLPGGEGLLSGPWMGWAREPGGADGFQPLSSGLELEKTLPSAFHISNIFKS